MTEQVILRFETETDINETKIAISCPTQKGTTVLGQRLALDSLFVQKDINALSSSSLKMAQEFLFLFFLLMEFYMMLVYTDCFEYFHYCGGYHECSRGDLFVIIQYCYGILRHFLGPQRCDSSLF